MISPNGYTDDFGPNVANILKHGTRLIKSKIPAQVRKELSTAVKAGALGHMKKDGLKPEVFYHPLHRSWAVEVRERHMLHSVECIAKCVA